MARSDVNLKLNIDTTEAMRDLRRVKREASGLYVPPWCRNPYLRAFVMGNAMLAPLLVILHALGGF